MARVLERSVSTISEEINRNKTKNGYNSTRAQEKTKLRRTNAQFKSQNIVGNKELREFVEEHLLGGQNPEAIAGRLRIQNKLPRVSKDSVYRFIKSEHGRRIEHERKKIRKRTKARKRKPMPERLKDRDFVEKRPVSASNRKRIGDCEGDFVVSGRQSKAVLLVVVDRLSRYCWMRQILEPTTKRVEEELLSIQKEFPEMITLTLDNDILFQKHKELEVVLQIKIYFTKPYPSWQKGTVENSNKHIRKHVPKGSDISKYSIQEIQQAQDTLNDRFMKVLDYKTPREVLKKHRGEWCSD